MLIFLKIILVDDLQKTQRYPLWVVCFWHIYHEPIFFAQQTHRFIIQVSDFRRISVNPQVPPNWPWVHRIVTAEVSCFFQIQIFFVVRLAFGVEENATKPVRWPFILHVLEASWAITLASTDSYQDQKSKNCTDSSPKNDWHSLLL